MRKAILSLSLAATLALAASLYAVNRIFRDSELSEAQNISVRVVEEPTDAYSDNVRNEQIASGRYIVPWATPDFVCVGK